MSLFSGTITDWHLAKSPRVFSPSVRQVKETLNFCAAAATSNAAVLFLGVRGRVGELLARMIHLESSRGSGMFRNVSSGLYAPESLECRIFGRTSTKRSYVRRRSGSEPGEIGVAHNGTLFIDQIQLTSRSIQSRLLNVLRDCCDVEHTPPRELQVRLIAASRIELEPAVMTGRFCPRLANRLNVLTFQIPEQLASVAGLKEATRLAEEEGMFSSGGEPSKHSIGTTWRSLINGAVSEFVDDYRA
jgi:DNA-binding NtrC family response regulator